MTRPSTARAPTMEALLAEARRVFGPKATIDVYSRPHYLPMVQAGADHEARYVRVALGRDDTVAEAKTRLLLCLKALPSAAPKRKKAGRG